MISFNRKLNEIGRRIKHKFKPNNRKVDFIIIGTQKGGTTALDTYLRQQHRQICMADYKELHYFDNDDFWTDNAPNYRYYQNLFSPKKSHKIIGETTPVYLYWNPALQRIYNYNAQCKLIVLLRNPIERAYSHWNMSRDNNKEQLPFLQALKAELERAKKQAPEQLRTHSYIDRGLYVKQLQTLWHYFPKTQTLILKSEDLKQNPQQTLNRVCDFLGVERIENLTPIQANSRSYLRSIDAAEKQYLLDIFTPEIRKLEKTLGWDCANWLI